MFLIAILLFPNFDTGTNRRPESHVARIWTPRGH